MNDLERSEFCKKYAKSMMMMAKTLTKKHGVDDDGVKSYIKEGIKSCEMAIEFKKVWDQDSTDIIYMDLAV